MTNRSDETNLAIQSILKEIQTEWDRREETDKLIPPQEWCNAHADLMQKWNDSFKNKK